MKKFFIVLVFILLTVMLYGSFAIDSQAQTSNEIIIPNLDLEENKNDEFKVEELSEFIDTRLNSYSKQRIELLIIKYQKIQENAHMLAEAARSLGWSENSATIQNAKIEWSNAQLALNLYKIRYDEILKQEEEALWELRAEEYPTATTVWLYMKELGWNDYICAGIIGNMMAETAGGTLNLHWDAYGQGFYGLCQWSRTYCSGVWGTDLLTQCDYLRDTIKYEFDVFGYAYAKDFDFDSFLQLTDAREAALAFSKCYERNAPQYTAIRADYAEKAYSYFVGE